MDGKEVIGTFNNEGRTEVDELKAAASAFIDLINKVGKDPRRNAIAVTHVETAAMFAVKSLFV